MPSEPERDTPRQAGDSEAARALRAAEASLERLATDRLAAIEAATAALAREQAAEARAGSAAARVTELQSILDGIVASRAWRVMSWLWALAGRLPSRHRPALVSSSARRDGPPRAQPAPAPASAPPASDVAPCVSPPPIVHSARRLTPRAFRVAFITPDRRFVSHRVRVANYAAYLGDVGIETRILDLHELEAALAFVPLWDVVVVFRLQASPLARQLYEACRRAGVLVVYDVDDLVFDPAPMAAGQVDALRTLPPGALPDVVAQPVRFLEALRAADACTVTTSTLAEACRALGRTAIVLPNGLDPHPALLPSRPAAAEVWLGYASGTLTHQRDFRVIASALATVLARHRHARLRIIGELEMREFPELDAVALQIEHRPLVAADALVTELAAIDVALAPLEIGNPFCEAKSPLKWLEAAAVGVPTVASATASFAEAIRDGETGFLARTTDDWERVLGRLVTDDALRVRIGSAARAVAERDYAPARLGARARDAYAALLSARRASDPVLTVTFVVGPVSAGGPVPRRTLGLADALAARGHEVRLAVCGDAPQVDATFLALRDDGLLSRLRLAGSVDDVACCDVLAASTPLGVSAIAALPRRAAHRVAIGVSDLPAAVAALPWEAPGNSVAGLPLFVEHARWTGDAARSGRDWLVCVLPDQTDTPVARLALETMEALAPAAVDHGLSLVLVGAPHDGRPRRLAAPHVDLGWQPIRELALVFRRAALGLVLRDPFHTTTGFALLACGAPVVALDDSQSRATYAGAENVVLAPPRSVDLADAVRALLRAGPEVLAERAGAGQRWARSLPGPDQVAAILEARLRSALAG